jgi:hypothetical protein
MTWVSGAVYPVYVNLVLTITVGQKCLAILLFTGVAAPIAGLLFRRVGGSWDSIGKGPFAIEQQLPQVPRYLGRPVPAVDPAIQAAEVRQMLEAKAERLKRRGGAPLDVEAEASRLLAPAGDAPTAEARHDGELRAEVHQLVVSRNERRMRKGLDPLDVEAETDRQLDDFIGSP